MLVDRQTPSLLSTLDAPRQPVTPDEQAASEIARPSFTDTIRASFRTQNEIGSILAREDIPDPYEIEDGFSSFDFVKGTKYEGNDAFLDVFNRRAAEALARQIDREDEDRRTVAASGGVGIATDIAAGVLSPTLLLPGGAIYRSVKGGYQVGRSALSASTAAVAATAAQETVLQSTQETRSAAETGFALGASALLGGFVGGGAAAMFSRSERKAAERAVRVLTMGDTPSTGSAGAASVSDIGPGDLDIAGRAAGAVGSATSWVNPNLYLNTSPSKSSRLFGQQLAENSIYQAGNDFGVTAGPAVERLAANTFNARIYQAEKALDTAYKAGRKSGMQMSRLEFENAVGRAARRNDEGDNEWVSSAARAYRSNILDPYKNEAVGAGLLPEDVKVTTADSYLHRMWDFQKLTAGEGKFKDVVRAWVKRTIDPDADLDGFADADDYANEVANLVYDKLTGRAHDPLQGVTINLGPRGPLKERTFDIPDALVEDFLNNNVVEVGRRYSRLMSADVELTRRFGSVDMKDQRAKVADDYRALRESVEKAETLQDIREITGKGFTFAGIRNASADDVREKALDYLARREKGDLQSLDGLRDLVRGTYGIEHADGAWNRISRAAGQVNYIRLMGGVVVASLGDIYRPAMVHGLRAFMGDGIRPLLTEAGREAMKLSVADAQSFGLVVERYTQGRLATFAEIGDPYRRGTSVERLLDNATRVGSRWNGVLMWTDAMKGITSVMSQNRVIKGVTGQGDDRFLAYLGINPAMKGRIADQIAEFGDEIDGIHVANVTQWTDAEAAKVYGAAIGKDVESVIVTKGVGDVPLFANTPTGRLILQFKSFMFASHQKVLMRGLQESPTNFISGMVGMAGLGMLAAYVRAWRGGEERFDKFRQAAENPGYLIGEGLDLSGIFALPMEAANMGEKILQTNVVKDPLKAMFPEKSQQGSSLRYQSRGVASTFLGPSASLIDIAAETAKLSTMAAAGEATGKQKERLWSQGSQMVPFYSYPGMREMMHLLKPDFD